MERASEAELVIPVTALIETGNHIARCGGDRWRAATAYARLVESAVAGDVPWRVNASEWDSSTLRTFLAGSATGRSLVDLLAGQDMGGGDMAIVVEAQQLLRKSFGLELRL